ncbi:MAG: hypothetical protein ACP5QK_05140 [Myxococcota bacterium]
MIKKAKMETNTTDSSQGISKEQLLSYLNGKRNMVLNEIEIENDNNKKIALYAMLGTIDTFIEDVEGGLFDRTN